MSARQEHFQVALGLKEKEANMTFPFSFFLSQTTHPLVLIYLLCPGNRSAQSLTVFGKIHPPPQKKAVINQAMENIKHNPFPFI